MGRPEYKPGEKVGYEIDEAGSPLALADGQFTWKYKGENMTKEDKTLLLNLIDNYNKDEAISTL